MLYTCYMHVICILYAYIVASRSCAATRTAFFLENHITHLGATCNLPHNWSFLLAFYMHYIGILYAFIWMLYAVYRHCIMHRIGIVQACYMHCICIVSARNRHVICSPSVITYHGLLVITYHGCQHAETCANRRVVDEHFKIASSDTAVQTNQLIINQQN